VLNTPSNHRVHHGRNPKYIDRNHGGILIVWVAAASMGLLAGILRYRRLFIGSPRLQGRSGPATAPMGLTAQRR
jgi:hypothetical protein